MTITKHRLSKLEQQIHGTDEIDLTGEVKIVFRREGEPSMQEQGYTRVKDLDGWTLYKRGEETKIIKGITIK